VNKEEQYEQIERYLREEMTPAERADFALMLANDAVLKKEMVLHAGLQGLARREEFVQSLSGVARDHFAAEPVQAAGSRRLLYWSAAAAVVLLAAIGIFLMQSPSKSSSQELFMAYFAPYDVPTALRSEGSLHTGEASRQAFERYSQKDYAAAIPLFSQALEDATGNKMLLVFSRGICYLATDNTPQAEHDFQMVLDDNNSLFVDQAGWYLALTHLKAGQTEAARAALRSVRDARAKALLRDLK
jgi:tetratricopeptide (TPR) repeat protein